MTKAKAKAITQEVRSIPKQLSGRRSKHGCGTCHRAYDGTVLTGCPECYRPYDPPDRIRKLRKKLCPTCGVPQQDPTLDTKTEVSLSSAAHPLVVYMRMHSYTGEGSAPALAEKFVNYLDGTPSIDRQRVDAAVMALEDLGEQYPVLISVVVASVLYGRSNRAIAEELGVTDKTVASILEIAKPKVHRVLEIAGVFSIAS